MKKVSLPVFTMIFASLVLALATPDFALAAESGILKCRALTDASKRLACYDAINLGGTTANTKIPADAAAKTAGVATAAAGPRPSGGTTASTPTGPAAEFGLPPKQTAVGVDRIETTIKGRLESWQQGSRIRLANGQLWQVTDDSRGVCECDNRKVTVTRGAFGTYFLEIEGKGNAPRVRRIE